MDDLTIVMCLCIGNAVAWLLALYTDTGMRQIIWNVIFGVAGAFLCALVLGWLAPPLAGLWLLAVGPFLAWTAILAGQAARRALRTRPS